MWPEPHIRPFGCGPKACVDPALDARVIHDLSFPIGASTNDMSDQTMIPDLSYTHVDAIARHILAIRRDQPGKTICLMKGDVKTAFRLVPVHHDTSTRFAGHIPELDLVVIDLCLPFGWTGSPAQYGQFGGAIKFLVRRESPRSLNPMLCDSETFFCFDWVNDYVLVEPETPGRLETCAAALRLAMLAVLGPRSVNEKKFTSWKTTLVALGLQWDTEAMTVSMPEDKIHTAILRLQAIKKNKQTSRQELAKLLGSLRHKNNTNNGSAARLGMCCMAAFEVCHFSPTCQSR
ncbi:hypothetical protein PHMEG_00041484 [Phytophthora megakarya]|uniref:Reverse transcriptase domain-containing protein n=1 Tax=Phytophthora megakarya TaxID=4795 RepID=A0A225UBT4_9STRA|nr:hypothetical protein PHMEG_00041484 [Phytophthora megakarya]